PPESIDMQKVFDTWEPKIMEYFIDRGADVETGNPLARALCWRIRTALGVFKKYRNRFSTFQEQANIALRHHCKDGNLKWVSLMLWAGADRYKEGASDPDRDPDDEGGGISALAYATLYRHIEVFKLKQVKLDIKRPEIWDIARYSDRGECIDL